MPYRLVTVMAYPARAFPTRAFATPAYPGRLSQAHLTGGHFIQAISPRRDDPAMAAMK